MWWKWIWKWQFLIGVVIVGLWAMWLCFQIIKIQHDYLVHTDNAIVVGGRVVKIERNDWLSLLEGGGDYTAFLYWPYKYHIEFGEGDSVCSLETPYWDWRESGTVWNEFYLGADVPVLIEDGCNARVVSRGLAWRWIVHRALYLIAALVLIGYFVKLHMQHKKT